MKNIYKNIPLSIWVLCLVSFIGKSGLGVLAFFPLYLSDNLHLNLNTIGRIFSFSGLGFVIGSYLGGYLSDRFGALYIQTGSMIVEGGCFLCLGYFHFFAGVLSLMFLIGLSNAASKSSGYVNLAAHSEKNSYASSYALNMQATALGAIFGLIIAGTLSISNYSWLFAMNGVGNLAACILLVSFFDFHKRQNTKAKKKIQLSWNNHSFLILMLLVTLMGMCMILDDAFTLYLKRNVHISQSKIGNIFELQLVLTVLLQLPITNYFKRFNELYVISLGMLLMAFGYFMLPICTGFYDAIFCMTLITLGEMAATALLYAYVTRIAPEKNQGSYIGLTNCAFISLPLIVTPTVSMFIYTTFTPNTLWFTTSLLSVMICAGFFVFQRYSS